MKEALLLYIDTTIWGTAIIGIRDGEGKVLKENHFEAHKQLSELLLKEIDGLLVNQGVTVSQLAGITVNPGPGSFTGTRIGVSIANAIGYGLGLPINGQKGPILPVYSSDPTITPSKRGKI